MLEAIKNKTQAIWQDVRQFKNLELYLILAVIIILFIFDVFGEPSESALTEVFLAALAVLIYGQLDSRHKEREVGSKLDLLTNQLKLLQEQEGHYVQVYPSGRAINFDFTDFLEIAQVEIIVIGISLTQFTQRFTEMPAIAFKDKVKNLLANGVNMQCLLLDPTSEIALQYTQDRKEHNIIERVTRTKSALYKVSKEFIQADLAGNLNLYTYPHLPYCNLILVDPSEDHGSAIVSHYMYDTKRPETPMFHLTKASNQILFEKYQTMADSLIRDSILVTNG